MKAFAAHFFSADIRIRAAVIIALLIIIFWWGLGKLLIRVASLLPAFLCLVFKGVYFVVEFLICSLHGKVGSLFHDMDNGMAGVGNRIDTFLRRWLACWCKPKSRQIVLSCVVYAVFLLAICITYHADETNTNSFFGQSVYVRVENQLASWLGIQDSYGEEQTAETGNYNEPEQTEEENIIESVEMRVITQKGTLSIRDIPSTENCEVLERVEKNSTVFWKGDIAFGKGSNGSIEPWIKVETPNGTIGWARLIYLCPANEEDYELEWGLLGKREE